MTLKRRVLWIGASAVMAMALCVLGYVFSGSTRIESWVGTQLMEIGGSYLNPELKFDRLTYLRPRTILLDNLTLSSPDPANPGQMAVILRVKRARIELTEIPRRGQPIRFSEVVLESPEIYAIAVTPGEAKLVGFSPFFKGSIKAGTLNEVAAKAPMKLSDFLMIRHLEIKEGKASYDSRMPGDAPIWLDGLNAKLDFTPEGNSSRPGLYAIATTVSRKPALELDLQGHVDVDTLTVELAKLELTLDLQEKNAHFLPAELQSVLKSFEATGQLRVTASGILPLADFSQCTAQTTGELTGARVAIGQTGVSVGSWIWKADLTGGVATIRKADAQLLGGQLHLSGTIPLDSAVPAHLELNASGLQIQQMLRSPKPNVTPPYAGDVSATVTFSGPLVTWKTQAAGGGTFSIRQGRIDNLPVLGPVVTSISHTLSQTIGGDGRALTDTADGSFSFAGKGVQINSFAGTSGAMAIRGSGMIGFDRQLDLRINAGPMERLQNSLGGLGALWASASDAVAGYHVGGTLDSPSVSMELGGP